MKSQLLLSMAIFLVGASPSIHADILLGAPGVAAGTRIATRVPFKIDHEITGSYKFVFSGIQAKGDTLGAPGASGTNGNGGQFHLKAGVSASGGTNTSERVGQIEFRNIQEYNTAPLKTILITPAAVFKATSAPIDIEITWQGGGNAHKPNGIFNVLGEYQKDPPIPTGSLSFASGQWILEDSPNPAGVATIVRE
ncbi:hypothetical protein [Prosthecobacter dejongeii]|uniref:Uncharacterized protein n=1 Tax=Prosthecobacter dejongeii TaxID=48465 RepID=A0A7W7YHL7_9BACT|nr:hypothetical protein [Prosthecobacter dejongeii]MBB5036015.1 hypothetical protein [Prosthecobacter dejongeii]